MLGLDLVAGLVLALLRLFLGVLRLLCSRLFPCIKLNIICLKIYCEMGGTQTPALRIMSLLLY